MLEHKFQKRPGQRWTHSSSNGSKVQLDYVIINCKWKNSAKNCRSFNSFISIESDHRIVSTKVRLSLRANKKKSGQVAPYDWNVLRTNLDIRNTFVIQLSNRSKDLQDSISTKSTNTTFSNFQKACKEIASNTIPLKPKVKKRKPWETEKICQRRKDLHTAAKLRNTYSSPEDSNQFNNARSALENVYEVEQTKYLQNKINIISNTVSNKKSAEAWKTVNEISGRKMVTGPS